MDDGQVVRVFGLIVLISLQISATGHGEINFTNGCSQIENDMKALQTWTTGRNNKCEFPPAKREADNLCTIDASNCVPAEVKSYHGKNPQINGPNCWNLAMVMAGVLPSLRYSTDSEMAFFMSSPLCRSLGTDELKQPGDIGALRFEGGEFHGFMWISNSIVFSKNGSSKEQPYHLQSATGMINGYQELQNYLCSMQKRKDCKLTLDTLRCQSMDSYLNDPKTKQPKEIQAAFFQMDKTEKCLNTIPFHPNGIDSKAKKNIIQSMEVLTSMFESEDFQKQLQSLPKEQRDFIRGALQIRLNSMWTQVAINTSEVLCQTCLEAAYYLREGAKNLSK